MRIITLYTMLGLSVINNGCQKQSHDEHNKYRSHQINELEITKKYLPSNNLLRPLGRVLIRTSEGEYTEIGNPMFCLSDLNDLWIASQSYSNEINCLRQFLTLEVKFEALPGECIKGEIVYDNPRLEDNTKINLLRIKVNNQKGNYKPGMMAYVYLKRNGKETLVIPKSALLPENNILVWVENDDGMFEQRMVDIGIQNKREVEILSGLSAGDQVVTRGAFLLNSPGK